MKRLSSLHGFTIAAVAALLLTSARPGAQVQAPATGGPAGVRIAFDHFGKAIDPNTLRIAETGEPKVSLLAGNDVWLRLQNGSEDVISFETYSGYINIKESQRTGQLVVGVLAEGMEVGIIAGIEDANGRRPIFGSDNISVSQLPPSASVLFSVPRTALGQGRAVFVEYQLVAKGKPGSGETRRAYFRETDLPKR